MIKHYVYSLAAAAALTLGLSACSSDEPLAGVNGDGTVTLTAQLPADMASRAFGDGKTATTLTYAVYETGVTPLSPIIVSEDKVSFTDLTATVTLQLVNGKTYDIVFWADAAATTNPYTFDAATQTVSVDYEGIASNAEDRDAFFAVEAGLEVKGAINKTVTLKRPFAQVNFGTDDLDAAAVNDAYKDGIRTSLATKAYSKLNLATGAATELVDVTYAIASTPSDETFPYEGTKYDYLSMNYLLAAADREIADMAFTAYNGTTEINTVNISNVPVQRNYRTNIYGSLLTSTADFNVVIDPIFEKPDYNQEVVSVSTIAEANAALAAGAKQVTVTEVIEGTENVLEIPKAFAETDVITIDFKDASAASKLTVKQVAGEKSYPAEVALNYAGTEALELNIDAADCLISLASADNFAKVSAANGKVFWRVATAQEFTAALAKAAPNTGLMLAADIDLGDAKNGAVVAKTGYVIDGKGFTLSGKNSNYLLGLNADNVVIKNMNIVNNSTSYSSKCLQGYCKVGQIIENIVVSGKYGLVLNGASATANNLRAVNCNYAVNITKGSGVTMEPKLIIGEGCELVGKTFGVYADHKDMKSTWVEGDGWYVNTYATKLVSTPAGFVMAPRMTWVNDHREGDMLSPAWSKDRTESDRWHTDFDNGVLFYTLKSEAPNWYNWVGLRSDVNMSARASWSAESTLLMPEKAKQSRQSFWATVQNAAGEIIAYCVVGLKNDGNGKITWEWFDNEDESGSAWVDVENIADSEKYDVKWVCNDGKLTASVNGVEIHTYDLGLAETSLREIIFNSYSYAEDYGTQWSYPVVK